MHPDTLPVAPHDAEDLAASLDRLAREAQAISAALTAGGDLLSPEAALARWASGLGGAAAARALAAHAPQSRLVGVVPHRPADLLPASRVLRSRLGHVVCEVDDLLLVLVPRGRRRAGSDDALAGARALLAALAPRIPCTVAISGRLEQPEDLARAVADVRDLLALLEQDGDRLGLVDESWARLLTRRAAALLTEQAPRATALDALGELPPAFRETLEAWLEADGDAIRTAAGLGIHPNSLRYRLRRVEELCGVDLRDVDQRVALRLWSLAHPCSR